MAPTPAKTNEKIKALLENFYLDLAISKEKFFQRLARGDWELTGNYIKVPTKIKNLRVNVLEQAWNDFQIIAAACLKEREELSQATNLKYGQQYDWYDIAATFSKSEITLSPFIPTDFQIAAGETNFPIDLPSVTYVVSKESPALFIIRDTKLLSAIAISETENALRLINLGANINKYSPIYGNNPLLLAITKGWNHIDPENNDVDEVDKKTPEQCSQKPIINALLASDNLNINAVHVFSGMSALHIACIRGDPPELIQHLLAKGIDRKILDIYGNKAEKYLSYKYEQAQILIAYMAGNYQFGIIGSRQVPENLSTTATLPTRAERASNVIEVKNLFAQGPDQGPAKKRKM